MTMKQALRNHQVVVPALRAVIRTKPVEQILEIAQGGLIAADVLPELRGLSCGLVVVEAGGELLAGGRVRVHVFCRGR